MNKEQELHKIAEEIKQCRLCKKGGTGKAVPGEGSPDAQIVFIGEAPGKEEAKTGRPFVGRSGKFLRAMIQEAGISEQDIFITSPGHYLPLRGTPSKETVIHGRTHLTQQLSIINPGIVVLLGSTACLAMLDRKIEITRHHGEVFNQDNRTYFVTFHPAYAMRFPEGRRQFIRDFEELKKRISLNRNRP